MTSASFLHGVASGDPLDDRVIIWTRLTTDAERPGPLDRRARSGAARGRGSGRRRRRRGARPHGARRRRRGSSRAPSTTTASSPAPRAPRWGARGRCPATRRDALRFAMCSCAKYNAGHFNAYARIAERDDLDFLLHLGDYIYEASQTPPASQTASPDIGRPFEPRTECRTLAEYRTRYAQYRRDPDVQAMHARLPVIATLDDHELADGAWAGGATEHRDAEHGPWAERRDAAFRARWEWLPPAARRGRPDARLPLRRRSAAWPSCSCSTSAPARRARRRGGDARSAPLDARRRAARLARGPARSRRPPRGASSSSPSIVSPTFVADPDEPLRTALLKLKLIHPDGALPDEDQWDGYPVERDRLLDRLARLDDVVVLSGDIHVGLAGELRHAGRSPPSSSPRRASRRRTSTTSWASTPVRRRSSTAEAAVTEALGARLVRAREPRLRRRRRRPSGPRRVVARRERAGAHVRRAAGDGAGGAARRRGAPPAGEVC